MPEGNYTRRITERFLQSVTPRRLIALERILLYDFVTGRSGLLHRHFEGIDRYVLPYLQPDSHPVTVWIGGLASRRGDEAFNRRLARARATMVACHIFSRAPAAGTRHGVSASSFGEELSVDHTENSELYRSVLVLVNRAPPLVQEDERLEPRTNLRASATFNRFRVYLRWLAEAGEGLVGSLADFVIDYDIAYSESPPSQPVRYEMTAGGVGLGLLPVGGFWFDPEHIIWNPFTAPVATHTRGFVGAAQLAAYGLSAGPIELAGATMLSLSPRQGEWSVANSPFNAHGLGVASGASVVGGPLVISRHPP